MRPLFLSDDLLDAARSPGLPELDIRPFDTVEEQPRMLSRRALLGAALALPMWAKAAAPLIFEAPGTEQQPLNGPTPEAVPQLQLGEIPADFWQRPRTLHLYRNSTKEHKAITYWQNGKLDPEGYWQACALLRDVSANRMTAMDPLVLDIMRGMLGYYEAWKWNYPLVINSGFRTQETNNKLLNEGAAKNSQHLYGRAVDLFMPGISIQDIGRLAQYFHRGGVGFYPTKLFVHVDTGSVRTWRG